MTSIAQTAATLKAASLNQQIGLAVAAKQITADRSVVDLLAGAAAAAAPPAPAGQGQVLDVTV
ncbi:hypothetical protein ACFQ12_07860 [Methylobacterium trifolii]